MAKIGDQLRSDSDAIRIVWSTGQSTILPHLWLRDNCSCGDCRIAQTDEKKFMISSVAADLEPASAELIADELRIVWPDGHRSTYQGSVLRSYGRADEMAWSQWPQDFMPHRCKYQVFLDDDRAATNAMSRFVADGAIVLEAAPTLPGTLEYLAPRLGPVRELLFDRIHDVAVDPSGYNVAHTPLALPPHNDFASYTWPPSVQALHMLANETPGGSSIIVDGWAILTALRAEQPDCFDVLSRVAVPFREFDKNTETFAAEPIIRCDADDRISGLRFSNQLMQAIDPNDLRATDFYCAYRELCRRITDPESHVTFRLNGGEILVVAAHRVLHGREAFEPGGRRHLQDAYFEFDNVKNQLVVLRRKGGGGAMTDKVRFTAMEDGTQADYDLVFAHDAANVAEQADRVLTWLRQMDGESPYRISRLDHCLQTATRAENDHADNETIACALLHDIGDILAPTNHSAVAAALLAPYISEKNHWIVKHHGLFQGYYWFEYAGQDPNARDRFKDHEYYDACIEFCARWDQVSFDPNFATRPLEHFEPLVRELFARQPNSRNRYV